MVNNSFITRFAPSPTGYLHLGHAYSALTAFEAARAEDGAFILRIENIDHGRCRDEYEQAIYEDLKWLGLDWEKPVRRQSEHHNSYSDALTKLINLGVVYRCFKTRKEIAAEIMHAPHLTNEGPEGPVFTGEPLCKSEETILIESGAQFAWRFSQQRARDILGSEFHHLTFLEDYEDGIIETTATPGIFGDIIIARKDAGTSYHLASVHDDAVQNISHVIRGEDLRSAAHLHCLLQALLGFATPTYWHHALVTDETGRRLAKRDKDQTLKSLRESGVSANEIRHQFF